MTHSLQYKWEIELYIRRRSRLIFANPKIKSAQIAWGICVASKSTAVKTSVDEKMAMKKK